MPTPTDDPTTTDATPRGVVLPGPDHRDLYIIVIGIIVGILAGPWVLGRVSPRIYNNVFIGGVDLQDELDKFEAERVKVAQNMASTDMTAEGISEKLRESEPGMMVLKAKRDEARQVHRYSLVSRATAIVLAILAVMVVETLVDVRNLWLRSRLATARYALIALWLAMLFAQPAMLRELPLAFLVMLIAIALVVALVPMSQRRTA